MKRVIIVLIVLSILGTAQSGITYDVRILNSNYRYNFPRGIYNDQIVGTAANIYGDWFGEYWNNSYSMPKNMNPAGFAESTIQSVHNGIKVGIGFRMVPNEYGGTREESHALIWPGTDNTIVDLHPSGYYDSQARDVYNNYQVGVGTTRVYSEIGYEEYDHALLWEGTAESVIDLHPKGFDYSYATSIYNNIQGGYSAIYKQNPYEPDVQNHAMIWFGNSLHYVDLHLDNCYHTYVYDLDQSQQVGLGAIKYGPMVALLWTGSVDSCVNLHPEGYARSCANGVRNGIQVGSASVRVGEYDLYPHAMLWEGTPESYVDLHFFLPSGYYQESQATCIDINGNICGFAKKYDGRIIILPKIRTGI